MNTTQERYAEKYKLINDSIVMMLLPGERRWRRIGKVKGGAFVKIDGAGAYHIETKSLSLPVRLLEWLQVRRVYEVVIIWEDVRYITTVDCFFKHGQYLFFKGVTEKKIYLSLDYFAVWE